MGNGTIGRMMGREYQDVYETRPRLPRLDLEEREDVYYSGPRLRDYNEDLDPKSWGDSMKRHLTSPYVSDRRWEDKNLPRFNKSDSRVKLYTGTGPFPGETDTDRLSSASKSRRRKSRKRREEELLLSYDPSEAEAVSPERYETKEVGTQAREGDRVSTPSEKRKYKKNSPKSANARSYRSIPPDYKDDRGYASDDSTLRGNKGGLQMGPDGTLRTRYPWETNTRGRRRSVESDLYTDSSRSSTGSRRKAEPINKDIIDEALRNYGTVGRVEALGIQRPKERPDAERRVKIPRPVASGMVTEGSLRHPAPDYIQRKKIEMPRLTATRSQLRSMGFRPGREQVETSCQVPEDTFLRTTVTPIPDDVESVVSDLSEKPAFNYAEKIKEIYEEIKPKRRSTIETQTEEPEVEESPLPTPTPEPEPEPTPPPPRPVMVDTSTHMEEPVYEPPPVIVYERRIEPVVVVENEPEPLHKEIQADPDEIDNKPRSKVHTAISVNPYALLEPPPPTEEKSIQAGESKARPVEPVDQSIQTTLTPKVLNKKLQAYRKPEMFDRGSQIFLPDLDGRESIISTVSGSSLPENPYQPLSYGPPPPRYPQPKSWGTTAKVENTYSGGSSVGSSPRPSISDSHSQGVQTITTLDTRAASMIRKLHDLESLSGILDLEPEYASTHGDDFPPDVVSDTLSVKSGYSLNKYLAA